MSQVAWTWEPWQARRPRPVSAWSREEVERELRALWEDGKTASQCASALSRKFDVFLSRNAIIGKVHRLGLRRRRPSVPRAPRVQPASAEVPRTLRRVVNCDGRFHVVEMQEPSLPELPAAKIPPDQRKGLMELTNSTCRWPYGEPGTPDFFFCGAEEADNAAGRPYCRFHTAYAVRG